MERKALLLLLICLSFNIVRGWWLVVDSKELKFFVAIGFVFLLFPLILPTEIP
jgi:hypothetical protein